MAISFYECIHEGLLKNRDRDLLVWPEPFLAARAYTGEAILNRISAIRSELSGAGLRQGQSVLLVMPVTFDLVCTLLAIMAMGAVPVLPPAASSVRSLLYLAIRGDINGVITQRKLPLPLSRLANRVGITLLSTEGIAPSSSWLPPQPVDPNQPALISHSSGSTGRAKPIRRSHRVLLAQHRALSDAFPPWPGQRDFPLFPNILLHNLATGTVSILPDLPNDITRMEPARIVEQILTQHVQTLTGNVYYVRKLLQYAEEHSLTFPDVRALGIGGSPVPEPLAHSLKKVFVRSAIYVIYGSSEAEPIAIRPVGPEHSTPCAGYAVGTIHPALRVRISTFGTLTISDGVSHEAGEIEVNGAHVATDGNDWLRTGDFGYLDKHKHIFLTGRKGNERIHRGIQHYQVEHVLLSVDGVERAAARSTEQGFTLYIEGSAEEATLWKTLEANFPGEIFIRLCFRKKLPVDARHHSKIRYDQLG